MEEVCVEGDDCGLQEVGRDKHQHSNCILEAIITRRTFGELKYHILTRELAYIKRHAAVLETLSSENACGGLVDRIPSVVKIETALYFCCSLKVSGRVSWICTGESALPCVQHR